MKKIILFLAMAFLFQSCFTTRTSVGDYKIATKVDKENTYNYAKAKQVYLLWGLIPLGRVNAAVPPHGNCEIRTGFGFGDALVSLLTAGIVTMQSIKVKAPRTQTAEPKPAGRPANPVSIVPHPTEAQPSAPAIDAELEEMRKLLE